MCVVWGSLVGWVGRETAGGLVHRKGGCIEALGGEVAGGRRWEGVLRPIYQDCRAHHQVLSPPNWITSERTTSSPHLPSSGKNLVISFPGIGAVASDFTWQEHRHISQIPQVNKRK